MRSFLRGRVGSITHARMTSHAQIRMPHAHEYEHLGAYMRDLRLYYQLQVSDVAQHLNIRAKYIQAIEEGKPELMPGKVYARGYIANYAEFLGLNGEQTATQYLGDAEPVREAATFFVPEPKRVRRDPMHRYWKLSAVAVVAVGVLLYALQPAPTETIEIEQVPERLVEQLRNGVMPTPKNIDCLTGENALECINRPLRKPAPVVVETPVTWVKAKAAAKPKPAETVTVEAPVADVATPEKPVNIAEQVLRVPEPTKPDAVVPKVKVPPPVKVLEKSPDEKPKEVAAPAIVAAPAAEPKRDVVEIEPEIVEEAPAAKVEQEAPKKEDAVTEFFSGFTPAPADPNAPQEIQIPRRRR